ncbi:hypothetical protein OYG11_12900, partial [Actinobacillus pleuropneumoniae]|nr:hypothetical protein [Actinobacillus pleuropneumoniae]
HMWGILKLVHSSHILQLKILTQTDFLGTHARWVTKIQEYDLEIRPTKLVKGQGFSPYLD